MIMKANKQIGFIYKNNESIDKILKDGDVVFERGFLREKTSTTLPITFDGVGKDLKDYKVYGNTVQNGEPTPDVPIEMVSCGDRTKNMITGLNKSTTNYINFYFDKDMATQNMTLSGIFSYSVSNFSIFLQTSFGNESLLTNQSCTQNEKFSFDIQLTDTQLENIVNSTTTPSIQFYRTGAMSEIGYSEIMLRASNTTAEYEPYGKYKIPVNVRSENLIPTSVNDWEQGAISTSAGLNINSTTRIRTIDYYEINNDTNYYISLEDTDHRFLNMFLYNSQKEYVGTYFTIDSKINGTRGLKINIPSSTIPNVKYCRVTIRNLDNSATITSDEITTIKPMITLGNSKIPFVPYYNETTNIYLDEPLRKIDEYSDYIDFVNGKVVRQLGEVILDENSALSVIEIITSNNKFIWRYTTALDIIGSGARSNILSNNYIGDTTVYSANNKIGAYVNSNGITNFATLLSTVGATTNSTITQVLNLLKTWLSLHHTELIYPLATPTEESITLPNIPTVDGNNTLNIETEITPSQVYIKYKSNE